ncbi:hypothetical protein BGZ49_003593 [Haplosporangium sp. Z 27]|nr:hypothetical protein BGZ49_003593 [Haplosporangium sp. Z 27]
MDHELSPDNQVINGNNTSFFSDLSVLEGFGRANKESLGGLLYAFFRKFAIEFDYDRHVVSVRHGCYLTKESKEWHIPGKHYRLLCIEEPFDTTRNLGNSCDMASSKGLKQEFRRALDILNHGGSLDQICEQWVFPPYYYHNNSNNKSGSNSSFLTNNQAAGRRYGNGYRPQRHGPNPRSGGDSNRTDDSVKQIDSSRHSRASNNFHQANGRNERAGYDRRSRSSSATYLRDSGSTLNANHGADSFKDTRRGSDTKGYKDSSVNGSSNTEDSIAVEVPLQDRPRKSSVHGRDDSPKPILSHETQSLRTASSKTSPSSLSPTRSKSSNSKGGDGYKSHGGQKNNRSNGTNRDNRYGGKVPNATVELCLADIAKIVKKTDLPQLLSNSVETKKAAGKGSVIWSTNSNRGGSRGGGHSSARSQNSGAGGQTRSRSMVSSHGELEEAGPRFEITGSS